MFFVDYLNRTMTENEESIGMKGKVGKGKVNGKSGKQKGGKAKGSSKEEKQDE
jgi:hypothetical protein